MSTTPARKMTPIEQLAAASPGAGKAFQDLRNAVLAAGPLDNHTCELIVLGAMVTAGTEASFKTHARRLIKDKVAPEALRQAVLVTFAATTTFSGVMAGLRWVDEVVAEG
jgi:alkylhydroperoxidase/carboxymuconolactone decarboxylase family protein YurZ